MAKSFDFKKAIELVSMALNNEQRQKDFGKVEYAELVLFEQLYDWRKAVPIYSDGKFYDIKDDSVWFEDYTPVLAISYENGEVDFIDCYIEI